MSTETKQAPAKHTPGPWHFAKAQDNSHEEETVLGAIRDAEGWHIARIWDDGPNPEADAFLIAAAPELLDALDVAQFAMRNYVRGEANYIAALEIVDRAIRKATGGQQ